MLLSKERVRAATSTTGGTDGRNTNTGGSALCPNRQMRRRHIFRPGGTQVGGFIMFHSMGPCVHLCPHASIQGPLCDIADKGTATLPGIGPPLENIATWDVVKVKLASLTIPHMCTESSLDHLSTNNAGSLLLSARTVPISPRLLSTNDGSEAPAMPTIPHSTVQAFHIPTSGPPQPGSRTHPWALDSRFPHALSIALRCLLPTNLQCFIALHGVLSDQQPAQCDFACCLFRSAVVGCVLTLGSQLTCCPPMRTTGRSRGYIIQYKLLSSLRAPFPLAPSCTMYEEFDLGQISRIPPIASILSDTLGTFAHDVRIPPPTSSILLEEHGELISGPASITADAARLFGT